MEEPDWANVNYEKPDFQAIAYYSAPVDVDPNKTVSILNSDLNKLSTWASKWKIKFNTSKTKSIFLFQFHFF